MKNIYMFLILFGCLCGIGCSDDDDLFDVAIEEDMFSFSPVEGGSLMSYTLTDRRVNKVKVEYTDEFGLHVYKVADYASESMILDGFYSVQENVPVKVSFLDKNENESKVMNFTFDTQASTLYSCFDKMDVSSYWSGFQVSYDLQGRAEGSLTVYFVGTNPTTKLRDTILLENFRLKDGHNEKIFTISDSQKQDNYTVMIASEDDRQRIIRKEVWGGVVGVDQVKATGMEFLDPFNLSKEMPYSTAVLTRPGAFGKEYLFDGDVKGTRGAAFIRNGRSTPSYTFLAGPNALNRPNNDVYFVLDMKKPVVVGEMRFYERIIDGNTIDREFDRDYYTKLPCNVEIYGWIGTDDYNPETNPGEAKDWVLVSDYKQDPYIAESERWYVNKEGKVQKANSLAALEVLEPIYLSVSFPFSSKEYRFFKLQFNETYKNLLRPGYYHNDNNNVTFHELEVYVSK